MVYRFDRAQAGREDRTDQAGVRGRGFSLFLRCPPQGGGTLRDVCRRASSKLGVPPPARFERIAQVIRWVMTAAREREITLAIDEFQELLHVDPGTFSELQRDWDLLHDQIWPTLM